MAAPASGPEEGVPIDADLIKVLASDTRRDILRLLGERRRTLTELADATGLKKATILEHLQKLTASELIRRLDDGERVWVYYELTPRGKRILHPGRTRFYLILAGSIVGVLALGAIVAAAFLANVGGPSADPALADTRSTALGADDLAELPRIVAWRGLDDEVAIPVAGDAGGTLVLVADPPVELPVEGGRAILPAATLDALEPRPHALRLRASAGEIALPAVLDVRDPTVALAPRVLVAGAPMTLTLAVNAPGLPPPEDVDVRAGGEPVALSHVGEERTFTWTPPAAGGTVVSVGRLVALDVAVLPDLRVDATRENDTLRLVVSEGQAPLAGARVLLDGSPVGEADANGTIATAWPDAGERALVLVAPDGRTRAFAVLVTVDGIHPLPARLALSPYADPASPHLDARVGVENAGPAAQHVTLVARMAGRMVASALVEVPPSSVVEARIEAPAARTSPVTIDAYGARGVVVGTAARYAALQSQDAAGAPASAAPPATSNLTSERYSYSAYGAPDATATLHPSPVAATTAPSGAPEDAQVPAPVAGLVLALVAALALALRRRGSQRR